MALENRVARVITAGLVSILAAVLATIGFYVLLVAASFFIVMPPQAQSWTWVGGLLGAVFAITLAVSFPKILDVLTMHRGGR